LSHSGLANKKTVSVTGGGGGDVFTLTMRKSKDQNKPSKAFQVVKVKSADPKRVEQLVSKLASKGLTKLAVTRVQKLAQANKRAQRLGKGSLVVKYGRNAKPFPYNGVAAKPAKATASSAMEVEEDDIPAVVALFIV
jgi:hypothetical protein